MDRINRQQPERQHQRRASINSLSTITTSSSSMADRSDRSARDGIFNQPSHAKTSFVPSQTASSSTDEKYVSPSNGILPISLASDGTGKDAIVNNGCDNVDHEEDDDLYGSFSSIQEHLDLDSSEVTRLEVIRQQVLNDPGRLAGLPANASNANTKLDELLPKLARRMNNVKVPSTDAHSEQHVPAPIDISSAFNRSAIHSPPQARRRSSLSYLINNTDGDEPVIETMRTSDINIDKDSAAQLALSHIISPPKTRRATLLALGNNYGGNMREAAVTKVEGKEIRQDHELYALTYGMMLGIRVTTGRGEQYMQHLLQGAIPPVVHKVADGGMWRDLTADDYNQRVELTLPPEGSEGPPFPTPRHKLSKAFNFKDYMTNAFRAVRSLSGIDEADYMLSVAGDLNYIEFIANSKSGQFFFYSNDGKYMIKTQTKDESRLLRRIMPQYVDHLYDNRDSMLVRFYGMYRLRMNFANSNMYFVVMSSVFDTDKPIHVKYDVKGSTVGRLTKRAACAAGEIQKDLNLLESGRLIKLGVGKTERFLSCLTADAAFLESLQIMDYSLLIGVHEVGSTKGGRKHQSIAPTSAGKPIHTNYNPMRQTMGLLESSTKSAFFQSCHGGLLSGDGTEIYYFGIIDILQFYNVRKKAENFWKAYLTASITGVDTYGLSAVPPSVYAKRFIAFIKARTDMTGIQKEKEKGELHPGERRDVPEKVGATKAATNTAAYANTYGSSSYVNKNALSQPHRSTHPTIKGDDSAKLSLKDSNLSEISSQLPMQSKSSHGKLKVSDLTDNHYSPSPVFHSDSGIADSFINENENLIRHSYDFENYDHNRYSKPSAPRHGGGPWFRSPKKNANTIRAGIEGVPAPSIVPKVTTRRRNQPPPPIT